MGTTKGEKVAEMACEANRAMALAFKEISTFEFKQKQQMKGITYNKVFKAISMCSDPVRGYCEQPGIFFLLHRMYLSFPFTLRVFLPPALFPFCFSLPDYIWEASYQDRWHWKEFSFQDRRVSCKANSVLDGGLFDLSNNSPRHLFSFFFHLPYGQETGKMAYLEEHRASGGGI